MELKSKIVNVAGIGDVEVREINYADAEHLFEMPPEKLGKELIKKCLYIDGKLIFDGVVGLSQANKLFELANDVMEVNGMGKSKSR